VEVAYPLTPESICAQFVVQLYHAFLSKWDNSETTVLNREGTFSRHRFDGPERSLPETVFKMSTMSETNANDTPGKLVVGTFLTLDGVMQAPGGPDEDRDSGFKQGGWSVNYWDEQMGEVMDSQMAEPDALLLGRKTYEIFAAHWPNVDAEDDPAASKLNNMPKYVASRTLDEVEWNNSSLLTGDVAEAVEDLKTERDDVISVQGSHNLIQTLLAHDLIDEFWLWIFPVMVGDGKRLFEEGTIPGALELTKAETSSTGVQMLQYERSGEIELGSFALDDVTE
jgi:dihydrofolate reductase